MKNIQVIDGAINSAFDIFAATDEEFGRIFPDGHDVVFVDEIDKRAEIDPSLDAVFTAVYKRRVAKRDAMGIHGVIFFDISGKKYYPTRRDGEAVGIRHSAS